MDLANAGSSYHLSDMKLISLLTGYCSIDANISELQGRLSADGTSEDSFYWIKNQTKESRLWVKQEGLY